MHLNLYQLCCKSSTGLTTDETGTGLDGTVCGVSLTGICTYLHAHAFRVDVCVLLFVCVCFVLLCTIYASIWSGGPQIQFRPNLERSVLEIMFVYFVGHQCKVEGGG